MNDKEIVPVGMDAGSVEAVKVRVDQIKQLMKTVLKENMHYGIIPGCGNKPTLLQPGAQKLAVMFRLTVEILSQDIVSEGNGHKTFTTKTRVFYNGETIADGIGVCTTLEGKYRYRSENTGKPVPPEYWDSRDSELLGGSTFFPRKIDVKGKKQWIIFQRVEHDNPADYWNTCAKMSYKRAYISCVIAATGSSDIFTQDIEDMPEAFHSEKQDVQDTEPEPTPEPAPKPKTMKETITEASKEYPVLTALLKGKKIKDIKKLWNDHNGDIMKIIETLDEDEKL